MKRWRNALDRAWPRVALAVLVTGIGLCVLLVALVGGGDPPEPHGLEQLAVGRRPVSAPSETIPSETTPGETTPSEPPPSTTSSTSIAPEAAKTEDVRSAVDRLLGDYDEALGALYADPSAALDPNHPLMGRWNALVAPGSELSEAMLDRIRSDLTERSMVVQAGPEGSAFVTRVVEAHAVQGDAIEFEHCGYSPGVGVDFLTGEVLDAQRASTRGHGRAERGATGELVLVKLTDEELRLLEPGEADPCPSIVAATGGGA
jgi:hypothetical protein